MGQFQRMCTSLKTQNNDCVDEVETQRTHPLDGCTASFGWVGSARAIPAQHNVFLPCLRVIVTEDTGVSWMVMM